MSDEDEMAMTAEEAVRLFPARMGRRGRQVALLVGLAGLSWDAALARAERGPVEIVMSSERRKAARRAMAASERVKRVRRWEPGLVPHLERQIQRIEEAIAEGTRSVLFSDRSVTYRSVEELMEVRAQFEALVSEACARP